MSIAICDTAVARVIIDGWLAAAAVNAAGEDGLDVRFPGDPPLSEAAESTDRPVAVLSPLFDESARTSIDEDVRTVVVSVMVYVPPQVGSTYQQALERACSRIRAALERRSGSSGAGNDLHRLEMGDCSVRPVEMDGAAPGALAAQVSVNGRLWRSTGSSIT